MEEEQDFYDKERDVLIAKMAVIKGQAKDASADFNLLSMSDASKTKKKKAKRAWEQKTKECTDGLKDVMKRIAIVDCLSAYDEYVKAKANI